MLKRLITENPEAAANYVRHVLLFPELDQAETRRVCSEYVELFYPELSEDLRDRVTADLIRLALVNR